MKRPNRIHAETPSKKARQPKISQFFEVKPKEKPITTARPAILFLGGGNLSFELAFARKHPEISTDIVATSFDEANKHSHANKMKLISMGALVLHNIDATKLHTNHIFREIEPKHIFFVHPDCGNKKTSKLIENTFRSIQLRGWTDAKVHMIRLRGGQYELNKSDRHIFSESINNDRRLLLNNALYGFDRINFHGFGLLAKHRVNLRDYPEYKSVCNTNYERRYWLAYRNNSLDYVFDYKSLAHDGYDSEEVESDDEQECFLADLTRLRH